MRFLKALIVASLIASPAFAQTGTVTNHAFALGKGPGVTGLTSLLCTSAQLAVGQAAADPICQTITGDVTISAGGVTAIGANKVTNSQAAQMAANTTKCNATGGTANPTDCVAATMRTNIGVVIGTNVEAWDSDLDCLAALATTGFVKRTGSGTCSAASLALSDFPTGTQDTALGFWGSTSASALAINNCSNALTYNTTTHTFGCNASAGTGTVTSVATAGLATGGPISSTGTVTVTAAIKSDQTTATSTSVAVVPGVQQNHPSSAKAWGRITYSGSTPTLQGNYNIASISRTSIGVTQVTLTVGMASSDYVVQVSGQNSASNSNFGNTATITSSTVFLLNHFESGALADPAALFFVIYGTN